MDAGGIVVTVIIVLVLVGLIIWWGYKKINKPSKKGYSSKKYRKYNDSAKDEQKHLRYSDNVLKELDVAVLRENILQTQMSEEMPIKEFGNMLYKLKENYAYKQPDDNKPHKPRLKCDFMGVYILHNTTINKYYVGQSTHVLTRVGEHFYAKQSGNKEIYLDYKNGYDFTVQTIKYHGSGFSSLDMMEAYYIRKYKAYPNGYNSTPGNVEVE